MQGIRYLLAGGLGGGVACAVAYPLDLVRTRLSAQMGGEAQYSGVWNALRTIAATDGLYGLYKGLGATLCQVRHQLLDVGCINSVMSVLLAGVSWSILRTNLGRVEHAAHDCCDSGPVWPLQGPWLC